MRQMLSRLLAALCSFVVVTGASASPTLLVSNGILMGATGVNVLGTLYDVQFVDGSCASVYDGCQASAFPFTDATTATAAAEVINETVTVDKVVNGVFYAFDELPYLTFGCSDPIACITLFPYAVSGDTLYVGVSNNTDKIDAFALSTFGTDLNTSVGGFDSLNFAVFTREASTSVPEPALITLTGIGLLAMATSIRRRAHSKENGS